MRYQVFQCLITSVSWRLRRIRDKGGGVKSKATFKRELRSF